MSLQGVHHVAYRCRDAAETVNFYRDMLGMEFLLAIAEDKVPSTGEPDPYMHVFLDAGNDNVLAFFELPTKGDMGRDRNTPAWVQHIAFKLDSFDELLGEIRILNFIFVAGKGECSKLILKQRLYFAMIIDLL